MGAILIQAIYITIIFIVSMALFFVLKTGGTTMREIIKSKLPGYKHKGAWFIQSDKGKKVKWIYKKIPNDLRIKIKSGAVPEEDQYAHITEIFHQTDGDGIPVLFTLEDLPFTFFLKKHHLDKFFPKLNDMINLIDEVVYKKMFKEAEELKLTIKNTLSLMRNDLKYIPSSIIEIDAIFNLEKQEAYKDKHSIIILLKYKQHLLKLRESVIENNNEMVDVHSLFETVGFVKNMTNFAFMEYQNGFLAAKQTKLEKKFNTILMVIMIAVGILVIVGMIFSYNTGKQITTLQEQLGVNSQDIKSISDSLGITIINDTNQPTQPTAPVNSDVPVNPLG